MKGPPAMMPSVKPPRPFPMNADRPLTTNELAERLTVTPRTLQNWRDAGKIPFLRITARSFRYDWDQVVRALNG